jgi:hypothetical protein
MFIATFGVIVILLAIQVHNLCELVICIQLCTYAYGLDFVAVLGDSI